MGRAENLCLHLMTFVHETSTEQHCVIFLLFEKVKKEIIKTPHNKIFCEPTVHNLNRTMLMPWEINLSANKLHYKRIYLYILKSENMSNGGKLVFIPTLKCASWLSRKCQKYLNTFSNLFTNDCIMLRKTNYITQLVIISFTQN